MCAWRKVSVQGNENTKLPKASIKSGRTRSDCCLLLRVICGTAKVQTLKKWLVLPPTVLVKKFINDTGKHLLMISTSKEKNCIVITSNNEHTTTAGE